MRGQVGDLEGDHEQPGARGDDLEGLVGAPGTVANPSVNTEEPDAARGVAEVGAPLHHSMRPKPHEEHGEPDDEEEHHAERADDGDDPVPALVGGEEP